MNKKEISIAGKRCFVFADESPEVLLVEPMDEWDLEFLDREIETLMAGTDKPFALGIDAAVIMLRRSFGSPDTTDGTRRMSGLPSCTIFTAVQLRKAEFTSI